MQNCESPKYRLFVGIDIAQASFVTALQSADTSEATFTLTQSAQGFEALRKRLEASTVTPAETLVVMEATGSYWIPLALNLQRAGYAVSVINPAQAYHFAKALLKRSKTDALDATRSLA